MGGFAALVTALCVGSSHQFQPRARARAEPRRDVSVRFDPVTIGVGAAAGVEAIALVVQRQQYEEKLATQEAEIAAERAALDAKAGNLSLAADVALAEVSELRLVFNGRIRGLEKELAQARADAKSRVEALEAQLREISAENDILGDALEAAQGQAEAAARSAVAPAAASAAQRAAQTLADARATVAEIERLEAAKGRQGGNFLSKIFARDGSEGAGTAAAAKAALTKAEQEVKVVADEVQPTAAAEEVKDAAALAGNATSLFDRLLKKQ